ncbi:hypothetical protein [Mucilaginibacter sp.]|jgi:hypothetical protein|uniref:hypothetical protein n=1 Tax=Mucilaginibacter sp. TaxID=1882438 RepID=UPI002BF06D6C|nr:hypothetical protein [Mucilaginibacter sp.]HTI57649.1 hypothetical protein [Mucilaginibacter sp.]
MKKLLLILSLYTGTALAQDAPYKTTHQFTISGKVKKESVITLDSLNSYPLKEIGDIRVTNHLGDFKHNDEKLKGVLLKDILNHSQWAVSGPKFFSELYFVCTGADGYKVVYSWNELFNTQAGDQVYILMEKNGVKAGKLPESLQMASMLDMKTGRRYLHNLDKIVVCQAQ